MRSRVFRRRRERGGVAHVIVLASALSVAGVVAWSEASVGAFAREESRLASSDEAFALAESGLAAGRAWLDGHDAGTLELAAVPLGRGSVDVRAERLPDGSAVVVATGRVVASPFGGKAGPICRRLRARLERRAGASSPAGWAVAEWKEL